MEIELLALKKLNMSRLSDLKVNNSMELRLAQKLDNYLTRELNSRGMNIVPEDKFISMDLFSVQSKACDTSYANFTTEKKRSLELSEPEMMSSEPEMIEKFSTVRLPTFKNKFTYL
jgi:hypothetical protein